MTFEVLEPKRSGAQVLSPDKVAIRLHKMTTANGGPSLTPVIEIGVNVMRDMKMDENGACEIALGSGEHAGQIRLQASKLDNNHKITKRSLDFKSVYAGVLADRLVLNADRATRREVHFEVLSIEKTLKKCLLVTLPKDMLKKEQDHERKTS